MPQGTHDMVLLVSQQRTSESLQVHVGMALLSSKTHYGVVTEPQNEIDHCKYIMVPNE